MKSLSWNSIKKTLFLKLYLRKEPNRTVYIFSYLPAIKAELQRNLVGLAKTYDSFLLALPTAFLIAKQSWHLQGPKIFLLLCPELHSFFLKAFFCKHILSFFVGNKWYAFYLVRALDMEKLDTIIAHSFQDINSNSLNFFKIWC